MNNKLLLFLLCLLFAVNSFGESFFEPVRLTCEYAENPLGIDLLTPRLSWNLTSTERNQFQTAYEIIVSDNEKSTASGKGNVWQTGKVISNTNINIDYAGRPLLPFTKYFWRVKVYNKNGLASGWSNIATFETAALQPGDWKARWISDGSKQFEKDEDFYQNDPMPLFRKQINVTKKITAARLYISGLGYSEVYINDVKIGDHVLDPGFTAYKKQVLYVTCDVTAALKNKTNTIGIMLGNGWYNPLPLRLFGRFNLRNVQQTGRPCVKAQVLIKYADGTAETIATDETWETSKGPVIRNNVYLGEVYDARLEKKFSDKTRWSNAVITDGPSGVLTAQMQPAIRITKIIKPLSIQQVGKDTFIADMGQNFAGVANIKVRGKSGDRVALRYGELLNANGSLNYMTTAAGQIKELWHSDGGPGSPKTAWQEDSYILKGEGTEEWHPHFTFHGFRYVEITGWPGIPAVDDIEGLRMNSDLEQNGDFSCSNKMFNQLHNVIQWTFLSNVFSVQSDCPAREKMGYGADIVATAGAFIHNYNMANFYRKAVNDFANDQRTEGGITEIAPSTGIADRGYGDSSGPLGWQLAFPYLQKQLYDYYGDKRIVEEYYPAFKRQMDFLQAKAIDGLYYWDIGDHESIDTKADAFAASCFYYHHALLAQAFAAILGNKDDSVKYEKLAMNIRNNIVGKYLVPGTGRFDNATQSPQIFALWYDLSPEKEKTLEVLLKEFQRKNDHLSTGIFSTMMMMDVLRDYEQGDFLYKIINQKDYPGWAYMLENGGTTLWESWMGGPQVYSYNHPMFGSVDEWFYKSVLGIRPGAMAFKKIIIQPHPSELEWAKGSYQSMYGYIKVDWKKSSNNFSLNVTIPVNTTAEIYLPAEQNSVVMEKEKAISTVSDIRFLRKENGYNVYAVGSGYYDFSVKN